MNEEQRRQIFTNNKEQLRIRLLQRDVTIQMLNNILLQKNREEINDYKDMIILVFNNYYIIQNFVSSTTFEKLNNIETIEDDDIDLIQILFSTCTDSSNEIFVNLYIEHGFFIYNAIIYFDQNYWWNPSSNILSLYFSTNYTQVINEYLLLLLNNRELMHEINMYYLVNEPSSDEEMEDEEMENERDEESEIQIEQDEEMNNEREEEDETELLEIEIDERIFENEKCFDFSMYDSIDILDHLKEKDTFLFVNKGSETRIENFDILCFSYDELTNILEDKNNRFLECFGELNYNYKPTIYVKLPIDKEGLNGFFPIKKLESVLWSDYRVYYIVPKVNEFNNQKMVNYSISWINAYGPPSERNYVSANHCQEGSNILIYDIKICKNPEKCIYTLFNVEEKSTSNEDNEEWIEVEL